MDNSERFWDSYLRNGCEVKDQDQVLKPVWWNITIDFNNYAVRAVNAIQAVSRAEQIHQGNSSSAHTAIVADESYQREFDERYDDRSVIKLIPFSIIECPTDFSDMTDEQIQAIGHLREVLETQQKQSV